MQFNKIFEKMLHTEVYLFLTKLSLLSDKFQEELFHQLWCYDDIVNEIDQNLYNCCIFLVLSKAFDEIPIS